MHDACDICVQVDKMEALQAHAALQQRVVELQARLQASEVARHHARAAFATATEHANSAAATASAAVRASNVAHQVRALQQMRPAMMVHQSGLA